jgi:thioredoxin 1
MFLKQEQFETDVLQAAGPVLVDFYGAWCPPCQALEPVLRELARDYPVCKVDIGEAPELASLHGVMAVPTLLVFQGGKEVRRFVGLQSGRNLRQALDRARAGAE